MKIAIHKLINKVGRRGAFLLFLALLDFVYAFALYFPGAAAITPIYLYLSNTAPLEVFATLWAIVGVLCSIYAFRKEDAPAFAAAIFIKASWAVIFLLGWLFADVDRGYLTGAVWGAFAAVVGLISTWPDPDKGIE